MTPPLTSPRRFPSYSCDRDPQPLFDELDAVLADFGVCLSVKQEERLRRRFARSTYDVRGQVTVLAPFANQLLIDSKRGQRLVARAYGEYELKVPEPPRPVTPPWQAPAWSAAAPRPLPKGGDDALKRFFMLVLLLGAPIYWLTCAAGHTPQPVRPRVLSPPYERMMRDAETQRRLDELLRQLERRRVELKNQQ